MNRLERLRDVPDVAWRADRERLERYTRSIPPGSRKRLPLRVLKAAIRSPARLWLMARMAATYFFVSGAARFRSLPQAFALISPPLTAVDAHAADADGVVNALDTLLMARVPFVRPQCWRRAAVLHRFLREVGIDTTIVFGVAASQAGQVVDAHAWLERDGRPFAEAIDVRGYRRVFEFPGTRPDPVS